jgi:hypothetical protein
MTSSAVERVPIEIWHSILQEAVASPLLPFTEESTLSTDLMDNLKTLSAICKDYRIYWDVTQATVDRLRLVCRTRASILEDHTSDVVISDLTSESYPSGQMKTHARRVHFGNVSICDCDPVETEGLCIFLGNRSTWTVPSKAEMYDDQFLHARIPNVRILLLDSLEICTLNFLSPLSNLVALLLYCEAHPEMSWFMGDLSSYAPRLTHLQLECIETGSHLLTERFRHENLRYLSLTIKPSEGSTSPRKVLDWTFPSLETFRILGQAHEKSMDFMGGFLTRHARNLKGLDIGYHVLSEYNDAKQVPSDLWSLCPALTQFGIHSHYLSEGIERKVELLRKDRDPSVHPPLELLIHEVTSFFGDKSSKLINVLQRLIKSWNISRIIIEEPWNDFRTFIGESWKKVRHLACS